MFGFSELCSAKHSVSYFIENNHLKKVPKDITDSRGSAKSETTWNKLSGFCRMSKCEYVRADICECEWLKVCVMSWRHDGADGVEGVCVCVWWRQGWHLSSWLGRCSHTRWCKITKGTCNSSSKQESEDWTVSGMTGLTPNWRHSDR